MSKKTEWEKNKKMFCLPAVSCPLHNKEKTLLSNIYHC